VCATVTNVFLGPQAAFSDVEFLEINQPAAGFVRSFTAAVSKPRTILFNGCFSLLNANAHTALEYARQHHLEVIVYWHETAFNLRLAGQRLRAVRNELRSTNVQHWTVSSQGKQLLMYILGCSFEDVTVVYEALTLPDEPPQNRHESRRHETRDELRLCGAGHLIDLRKGVDYFIEISKTLTSLDGRTCQYRWYGDTHTPAMHYAVADRGRVQFTGYVDDLPGALAEQDIFLLTSRDDPAPLVAFEALACDLPVFCFDATGIVELVPHEFVAGCADEMIENITRYWQTRGRYPRGLFYELAKAHSTEAFVRRISRPRQLLRADVDLTIPGWALQHQASQRPTGRYMVLATAPGPQVEAALGELVHPPVSVLARQQLSLDPTALGKAELVPHSAAFVGPELLEDPIVFNALQRLALTGCLVLFNREQPRDYGSVMELVDQLALSEVWGRTPSGNYYRLLPNAAAASPTGPAYR